jgi:hypothetical protein
MIFMRGFLGLGGLRIAQGVHAVFLSIEPSQGLARVIEQVPYKPHVKPRQPTPPAPPPAEAKPSQRLKLK